MARAFKASSGCSTLGRGVDAAAKVHDTHGERDSQRIFKKFGLTLSVPISELQMEVDSESGAGALPFLRVSDYMGLLLRRHPKLLFGGLQPGPDSERLLRSFWQQYRKYQPDHMTFTQFDDEQLGSVLPIAIHGDKGRTLMKRPIFCFSFEPVFGMPMSIRQCTPRYKRQKLSREEHGGKLSWSCSMRAQERGEQVDDACKCPLKDGKLHEQECILHNGKGNTFMSRFLIAAVPSKFYTAHADAIPKLLCELKKDLTRLFHEGVKGSSNKPLFAALIGVKGDFEFHLEVAGFQRSYANAGTVVNRAFCPECSAGPDAMPAIDMSEPPQWAATAYMSDPWNTVPPLSQIPYALSQAASLYRRDPFHMLKYGFLRDLAASSILYLAQLEYWDYEGVGKSLDARLERAYKMFSLWLIAESKSSSLRKFSRGNFHRTKATKMPFLGGKGSDSILCLMYLEFFVTLKLRNPKDPSHVELLTAMQETFQGALSFTGVYISHPVFLERSCAAWLLKSGMRLLKGYCYLAQRTLSEGRRLYALRPKVHYFHHSLRDLQLQLDRGDPAILNYNAVFNCEANEDFIGRVSRISRRVSPKIASRRTLDRYLLACKLAFKRAGV